MPPNTPEVALRPAELSNVALRMAPRMHQNMQLETQKLKKFWGGALPGPSLNGEGETPFPYPIPIVSVPAAPLYYHTKSTWRIPNPNPGSAPE